MAEVERARMCGRGGGVCVVVVVCANARACGGGKGEVMVR